MHEEKTAIVLAALLILSLAGCVKTETKNTGKEFKTAAQAAVSSNVAGEILLIHACTPEGAESVERVKGKSYLAQAVLPDADTMVDHREVNGGPVDAGGRRYSLEFQADDVRSVEAVLRPAKTVRGIGFYPSGKDRAPGQIGRGKGGRVREELIPLRSG